MSLAIVIKFSHEGEIFQNFLQGFSYGWFGFPHVSSCGQLIVIFGERGVAKGIAVLFDAVLIFPIYIFLKFVKFTTKQLYIFFCSTKRTKS